MEQWEKEIRTIIAMSKNYAAKHQIIYSDTHERMVLMVIGEIVKLIGNKVLEMPKTDYGMDIYKNQQPNKS